MVSDQKLLSKYGLEIIVCGITKDTSDAEF